MTQQNYRCWVEIDTDALRHNAAFVRQHVGADVELLAVVKADAYGHGMTEVGQALAASVDLFGVANLTEAVALRDVLSHPIVILGPALPTERPAIAQLRFIPSVSTLEEAQDFERLAGNEKVSINFKIDTGMGRVGVLEDQALALFHKVSTLSGIEIHSVSTHLPVSDEDDVFTRAQLHRFGKLMDKLRTAVPGDYKTHALQTAGLLAFPEKAFDIVRPGMMLYGISPLAEFQSALRPAMTWKSRIVMVREMPAGHGISYGRTFITPTRMRVATVSTGYADGYPRHLSNRGTAVLLRGHRCALLGRVTMDLIMIDVSQVPEATVGEEVVLMGRQGDQDVPCAELAKRAETITWEIITRVGKRVRRVYV